AHRAASAERPGEPDWPARRRAGHIGTSLRGDGRWTCAAFALPPAAPGRRSPEGHPAGGLTGRRGRSATGTELPRPAADVRGWLETPAGCLRGPCGVASYMDGSIESGRDRTRWKRSTVPAPDGRLDQGVSE